MTIPIRIQRKRKKGWRMPPNTVYVGRPTKWGNPWGAKGVYWFTPKQLTDVYRRWVTELTPDDCMYGPPPTQESIKNELGGKNLACWCPLNQPCHADVLLAEATKGSKLS